ncbi:hypothetical protein F5Y10DRAFT_175345 [Nemania abortiva]|nr:hypothetical protein F5Y10DRAFT_175345 [Nemania abortiva]
MKQDETITLAQHSLYAVVRADKSLWQLPLTWSQTHLHALGVDRQSNNACVEYGCDKDAESLRALIPEQPFLESKIRTVRGYSCHERKAKCLRHLLVFMEPPPKLYPDTNALLFTCHQRALKLFVGSRAYRIHDEVTCFHLGRLAFAYLDAHRLRWPLKIRRKLSYGTVFDLDPCITGMLIAMAQAQAEESGTSSTTNKPVITTAKLIKTIFWSIPRAYRQPYSSALAIPAGRLPAPARSPIPRPPSSVCRWCVYHTNL